MIIDALAVTAAAKRAAEIREQAKQRQCAADAALIKSIDDTVIAIEKLAVKAMYEVAEKGRNSFAIGWNAMGSDKCDCDYKVSVPVLIADNKDGLNIILSSLRKRLPANLKAEASYWLYQEDRDSGPAILFTF